MEEETFSRWKVRASINHVRAHCPDCEHVVQVLRTDDWILLGDLLDKMREHWKEQHDQTEAPYPA